MIELPIIDIDMSRKGVVYRISQPAFDAEDGVYLVRLRPVGYDWTDKAARVIHSLEYSEAGHQSDELDVIDGVVSWQASAAVLRPGRNFLQLNIYGKHSEFRQIAPMVEWYIREALHGTDPMPDDVDAIEGLTAQVNTAVDSLESVETTCTEAAEAAAQSAEDADDDRIAAASALSQTLEAIGSTIAPLGTDGKVPIENIPATAITKNVVITDESQRATIDVEQNDVASLVDTINGELTVIKAWQLMGADKTDMNNWVVCGTSYAVQAGSAAQATAATNADKVDGFHFVGMTQAEYDAAVIEPTNTIYVVTP